jgi:trimethylamine:corrinoid methyltransferase-like protein
MNSEYYYPHTGDRQRRADWEADGSLDMREQARRKARLILNDHEPAPILPEIDAAIRKRFEILLPPNQHQTL